MAGEAERVILMKRRKPGSPDAGQWATVESTRKPKDTVIGCPGCGVETWLPGFVIARDGGVKPEVKCPCGFRQYVKLGEWAQPRGRGPRFRADYPHE